MKPASTPPPDSHQLRVDRRMDARQKAEAFRYFLYVWGAQWMLNAVLDYGFVLDPSGWIRTASGWLALGVTAVLLFRLPKETNPPANKTSWRSEAGLAAVLLLAAAALLLGFRAVTPIYAETVRAVLLAAAYFVAGARLGRELVWLGVWLLSFSGIISIGYLGYAPIMLGFTGGASLIACGLVLRLWNRKPA